jgi:hypothetical protein
MDRTGNGGLLRHRIRGPCAERDNIGRTIVTLATVLWIVAVVLVIAGIFAIIRKQVIWGVVLIVVGLLVGPGGVSIFT